MRRGSAEGLCPRTPIAKGKERAPGVWGRTRGSRNARREDGGSGDPSSDRLFGAYWSRMTLFEPSFRSSAIAGACSRRWPSSSSPP